MELLTAIYNYPSEFKYVSGETPMTHWMYPVVIGAIYMTTILGLRAIMNMTAKRIEARWFAAVHNWNMFAISLVCFVGISYGAIKLSFVRRGKSPFWDVMVFFCRTSLSLRLPHRFSLLTTLDTSLQAHSLILGPPTQPCIIAHSLTHAPPSPLFPIFSLTPAPYPLLPPFYPPKPVPRLGWPRLRSPTRFGRQGHPLLLALYFLPLQVL